jgi:pilus assembly protein CpaC
LSGTLRFGSKSLPRLASLVALFLAAAPTLLHAQADVTRLDLSVGRSSPLTMPVPVTKLAVANPEVADVVLITERDVLINGKTNGETDVLIYGANNFRRHYRVQVHTPADRPQVVLGVKFAEVRRDFLATLGISALYRTDKVRAGTQTFNSDNNINPTTGAVTLTGDRFLSVLSDFGTKDLLALIETEEQRGRARTLAEPNLMAANRDSAVFLAGGEIPIPIAQPGQGGQTFVTIVYREFGVRLNFLPEILNDSLVKLRVRPEVSSLDFTNSLLLSGFRVPALRTRRIESTVDVRRDRSLVISGLFNDQQEKVKTGIPLLMDIPILGNLFSSTQWQRNETELVVIVTPVVVDPMHPRPQDEIRLRPDTALPARDAIQPRLPQPPMVLPPAAPPRRP